MDHIISYFSDPSWWDIGHIHSWVLAAIAYALIALLIVRYVGTKGEGISVAYVDTGEPVPSVPLTPHEQLLYEERVAPYKEGVPHPHSPAHYYQAQVGTKRTFTDVDMDDPDWVRTLEEEL